MALNANATPFVRTLSPRDGFGPLSNSSYTQSLNRPTHLRTDVEWTRQALLNTTEWIRT